MLLPFRSTGLVALVALTAGAAHAQTEPTAEEIKLQEQIAARTKQLGDARIAGITGVNVNGEQLSIDAVLREAIFLIGAKQIDAQVADFFIEEHLAEAIESGRDPKEFEVSDKEIEEDVARLLAEFQRKNPGISLWDAVRAQYGMDKDGYLHSRRQTILFDRVFFPGPAQNWPVITREAIMASAQGGDGKAFWENLLKASTGPDGEPRELPAFWMQLCRGWVQKQLKSWSDIRYPSDGLPADVCLQVNEAKWGTKDAFERVRNGVYTQDIERAMTEVVVREALRQELVKAGAYMSDEEFRDEFDEYRQEFDNTPFTTEVIAVNFKGYPSLEAFRQRWRLMTSFERMIKDEINDENLQAHANHYKGFFGNGSVVVDVIQFLGRDVQTGAWLPDGVSNAATRAEAAMKEIENGRSFDEVLAERGEFFTNDKDKGRLGSKSLNQLRQHLRETEFSDLLSGFSVGHFLFFDAEPRKIHGPLRGPEGYFIAKVNARVPPRGAVSIQNERTRELVRQDYVNHRFRMWADEVVAKAKVQ